MSKARNLSKVIVDSSGIVDRDSLDVETVAKTGSYNDLTNKPTIPSGTVTSVAATVPTGLSVSGSPVTSSGTLAISYSSGYSIPTDVKQSNWDTAYSWGNHASAGYVTNTSLAVTLDDYLLANAAIDQYQPKDADLTAISAFSGASTGFLKKTGSNTWALDTNTYLTSYTETDPVYTASSWYSTTNNASNWDTAYGWGNHASAGYATYPSQTGNSGKYLTTNGSTTSWATVDALPSQTGNSGKYLTTNGTTASWGTLAASATTDTTNASNISSGTLSSSRLPTSGVTANTYGSSTAIPVITFDTYGRATSVTTATVAAAGGQYFGSATTKAIAYNSNTISENITVTAGNNGLSAGPVTVSTGYTVTVETGANWVIV